MVIRERVARFTNTNPQYVFCFAVASHKLDGFIVILAPKDSTCKSQHNFFDITSMVVSSNHDAVYVCTKLFNFGDGQLLFLVEYVICLYSPFLSWYDYVVKSTLNFFIERLPHIKCGLFFA